MTSLDEPTIRAFDAKWNWGDCKPLPTDTDEFWHHVHEVRADSREIPQDARKVSVEWLESNEMRQSLD